MALFVLACLVSVVTAEAARRYYDRSLASERRFRAAEDLAFDGFGILEAVRDPEGAISDFRWTYANPALATMLRRSSEDLIGHKLLELLPGHAFTRCSFQATFRSLKRACRRKPKRTTMPTVSAAGFAPTSSS